MTTPHDDYHGRTLVGIPGPYHGTAWALPSPTDPEDIMVTGCVLVWTDNGEPVDDRQHLHEAQEFLAVYSSLASSWEFDHARYQRGALRTLGTAVDDIVEAIDDMSDDEMPLFMDRVSASIRRSVTGG